MLEIGDKCCGGDIGGWGNVWGRSRCWRAGEKRKCWEKGNAGIDFGGKGKCWKEGVDLAEKSEEGRNGLPPCAVELH